MSGRTQEKYAALAAQLSDKKTALEAVEALQAIVDENKLIELVLMLEVVTPMMDAVSHKDRAVATAALKLVKSYFAKFSGWSAGAVLPHLRQSIDGKAKPATKEASLEIIQAFAEAHPEPFAREIEWIIHTLVILMNDSKASTKTKAKECLLAVCKTAGNTDLMQFIPTIVKANESTKNVPDCVEKLAGCVFVQNVEAPALAIITPVLWRGLNEKSEATQRRCCVIVDNMAKLVDDPFQGSPLLPEILPLVRKRADEISDPEAREMAEKTLATIEKVASYGKKPEANLKEVCAKHGVDLATVPEPAWAFMQKISYACVKASMSDEQAWAAAMPWIPKDKLSAVIKEVQSAGKLTEVEFVDDDESSPDLYKGAFTLAYGTTTLLRDAKLHLKKNKFYGLLGPNKCGKSTMLRAIANEQVEGFPKRDQLVTIFVEHTVAERVIEAPSAEYHEGKMNIDLNGIEFCVDTCNNVYHKQPPITYEEAEAELGRLGFGNQEKNVNPNAAADMLSPITNYSGGWKVKMQLGCAKLIDADIVMLDEPTGHFDVNNVQWMKNWLNNCLSQGKSIIATSSKSSFLDEMCTHIIDFQDLKLVQFKHDVRGEVLTKFVELNPSKSAYFELSNKNQKFIFPPPGPLEGVKSRGRTVLRMTDCSFKYPPAPGRPVREKNVIQDVSLTACMLSKVAVVGQNGAGKSTAIKLLIGEEQPNSGVVFRHSGMRLAYVAQHSFHHLDKHGKKTPTEYILWRFAGNDDRESLENQSQEINRDDEKLREVPWCIDNVSGVVRKCVPGEKKDLPVKPEAICNRRKNKAKKYEYEVKWFFKSIECNTWVERDTLLNMGYEKPVCHEDEKQAAAAGLMNKPLTAPSVEKELKNFGLSTEEASHTPIDALSDGQKFKVVLTGACWQNPHILVLDEPTNYLDRDGKGALATGLVDFEGGVVIISHDTEFTNLCCTQTWRMVKGEDGVGRLREEGELVGEDTALGGTDGPDEVIDAYGNKIVVDKKATMSAKDQKKKVKEIEKKLTEHKKKNNLSDTTMWELQDELAALKEQLGAK